ncbi:phosphoadenosine phosphosulfate reductase [Rhodothalassium salexigens]|uniref:phosphoadenylyl-sulfate reductase n=1 Tax=Rhodothalassium salexigens TaxID=1086 RepID=UPI001913D8BD|nr:phosphoadenylyl-sulfate reductase [Rhodothalassium salexigens]MBK5912199.1 phosphoadenosine phosphosulfate reductase [Rhodothalassium salexigens]MBK5919932.1 phosphoadenosine phosphosulfate reductase [Rhodothalassium salexigens]
MAGRDRTGPDTDPPAIPGSLWRTHRSLEREAWAAALSDQLAGASPERVIGFAHDTLFPGRLALVSSFGAESAALLAFAADVDRSLPVVFLDTHKLFDETLAYRDRIVDLLGLTDVRVIHPKPEDLAADDPDGTLHERRPDLCCHIRKTLPLVRALKGFDAWLTGRKQYQSTVRARLPRVEIQDGRVKINPLADWNADDVRAEMDRRGLPPHPLVAKGYPSIGCAPCTSRVEDGEDLRAGRWRGQEKTECGIHLGADGRWVRSGGAD